MWIRVIINAAILIYGGIIDYRRREIPDLVPVVLLLTGMFDFNLITGIISLVIPAALLLTIRISGVPGGDFKLICALGFSCGLPMLAVILLLSGLFALGYGAVRRLPLRRGIPLCSYVAPVYILISITLYLSGGIL